MPRPREVTLGPIEDGRFSCVDFPTQRGSGFGFDLPDEPRTPFLEMVARLAALWKDRDASIAAVEATNTDV